MQWFSRRAQGGSRELNANDAWIVACAKAAEAVLITTDSDFGHLRAPEWQVLLGDPNPFLKQPKEA